MFGKRLAFGTPAHESFRMPVPGLAQRACALLKAVSGAPVMDILGGEHGDAGMAMLAVVPREEGAAEGDGGVDILKARGEARMVFQGLELCLGEGVVVADPGAAERAGDAEVGEELRGALAGHGCATVGVQGKHFGLDALFEARFLNKAAGQCGALACGDHPSHHIAAEDIEQHIEIEAGPGLWSEQARDVP